MPSPRWWGCRSGRCGPGCTSRRKPSAPSSNGETTVADAKVDPTADEQVRAVLARDARRVRVLTWATVACWLIALVVVGWMLWGFSHSFMPRTEVLYRETPGASGRPGDPPPRDGASLEERLVGPIVTHVYVLTYGLLTLT